MKSEWIKADDGRPMPNIQVLACTSSGQITTALIDPVLKVWRSNDILYSGFIKYWMPAPALPEEFKNA